MTTFHVKHYSLPHDGVIPGAAGHKKVVVSRGTKVYCVVYGTKIFYCAYLYEKEALTVAKSFEETIDPNHKRHIPLKTLIAWNFKDAIPKKVHRPKDDLLSGMHGG